MPHTIIHVFTCAGCAKPKAEDDKWLVFSDRPLFFVLAPWDQKLAMKDNFDSACSLECVTKTLHAWSGSLP